MGVGLTSRTGDLAPLCVHQKILAMNERWTITHTWHAASGFQSFTNSEKDRIRDETDDVEDAVKASMWSGSADAVTRE